VKKYQLVQIPINHVCISEADLTMLNVRIISLQNGNEDNRKRIQALETDNKLLEMQLADSKAKVANLEKELNENKDRVLYWYKEHNKLQAQIDSMASPVANANEVKPDAETEES